jgi:hypothetical protein
MFSTTHRLFLFLASALGPQESNPDKNAINLSTTIFPLLQAGPHRVHVPEGPGPVPA